MEFDYTKIKEFFEKEFDADGSIIAKFNDLVSGDLTIKNIPVKFNDLYVVTLGLIAGIEKFSKGVEGLSSEDKRKAVVTYLDDCVKGNFLVEMFDGMLIGKIVDFLVEKLNSSLGKDWGTKIDEFMGKDLIG